MVLVFLGRVLFFRWVVLVICICSVCRQYKLRMLFVVVTGGGRQRASRLSCTSSKFNPYSTTTGRTVVGDIVLGPTRVALREPREHRRDRSKIYLNVVQASTRETLTVSIQGEASIVTDSIYWLLRHLVLPASVIIVFLGRVAFFSTSLRFG